MMGWLADNHSSLCFGSDAHIIDVARAAFQAATQIENNPGRADPDKQAEGGSATGAFIAFERTGDRAVLHGASIGDAAVIIMRLNEGVAQQLNPVYRKHDRDNGGQLTMCMGLDGQVWAFANELRPTDLVILATDGLTDNVLVEDFERLIPLVMSAHLFNSKVPFDCEPLKHNPPEMPSIPYLRRLVGGNCDRMIEISCEAGAQRLFYYVEWVTRGYRAQEEKYYSLCLQMKTTKDDEARKLLETQVAHMAAERKLQKKSCKTDDAMIIVMHPFHTMP